MPNVRIPVGVRALQVYEQRFVKLQAPDTGEVIAGFVAYQDTERGQLMVMHIDPYKRGGIVGYVVCGVEDVIFASVGRAGWGWQADPKQWYQTQQISSEYQPAQDWQPFVKFLLNGRYEEVLHA